MDWSMGLSAIFDEVNYDDFYRNIFPVNSFEKKGVYEDGKYNGIAVSISKGSNRPKRYTVTDDLEIFDKLASGNDFCLMSPISYAGKTRKSENARFLYALAIDLDGVDGMDEWCFLLQQIENGAKMRSFVWGLPKPTYLVASGTGIHIYYVFKEPIPLYRSNVKELEKLKRRLTWQAWTQGASTLHDSVQYESLFQGFRVVGTITKTGSRCRAFAVGKKVDIDYLNFFVPEEYQITELAYISKLTLAEAKTKYPEWYKKRIENGEAKGHWICKRDLYDWWIRQIYSGANQGHRYWCVMTLASYAVKCGIPKEELEKDAYGLIPFLNSKGDKFTEDDVMNALEAYSDSYITYPIKAIVSRTGIAIEKNKRNGRTQKKHCEIMRAIQGVVNPEWREGNGRPQKKELVAQWQQAHPEGKKIDCHRDTQLSRMTIDKWWQ